MIFSSYEFILLFLPLVVIGYWLLSPAWRLVWLLLASYLFYAYWDWRYLPLLFFSTLANYLIGKQIGVAQKRAWLLAGLFLNIGMLGFYKYYDFFSESLDVTPTLKFVLPLGLSFYTFQNISYLLDVYQKRITPAHNLRHYGLFVAIFPHLTAGPILRYGEMHPQLSSSPPSLDSIRMERGIVFFVIGLAKKVIIADQLATLVNPLLANHENLTFVEGWLAALGYTYQLYFDFCGYSEMAVGIALLLGFEFPRNFDNPYTARDIVDFWRRWHITLTTWLRDYVFLPASRAMLRRSWHRLGVMMLAYLLTMTISGLWHGTGITFLLWGIYHGFLICVFQAWRWFKMPMLPSLLSRGITFWAVVIGWVLFRAESLTMAINVYQSMLGLNGFAVAFEQIPNFSVYFLIIFFFALVTTNLTMEAWDLPSPHHLISSMGLAILFVVSLMMLATSSPFLYFQF